VLSRRRDYRARMRAALSLVVALALWVSPTVAVAGTFQVICDFSHSLPDDPIVFPGGAGASHLHDFLGNTSTHAASTYGDMVSASTTCGVSSDTSGYWVPAAIVDSVKVDPIKVNAYYSHGQGVAPAEVEAFPPDLRIVAGGDTMSPSRPRASSWSCQGGRVGALPTNCSKGKKVRAHVKFPNCWNGTDLDSSDHRSHMAYSTKSAGCPASHPVAVPAISLVIVYPISSGGAILLSSGAPTTMHGDFWNTWDQAALEGFTASCVAVNANCGVLADVT
jgi:hypothetical protein